MLKNLSQSTKNWLTGLSIVAVIVIIYYAYEYFKKMRIQSIIDGTQTIANVNGTAVTVDVGTRASEINDALHGSWYDEDEVKAVNSVLQVPKTLIPQLSQTYFTISGYNLKTDLQKYISDSQWLQIQHLFN